MVLTSRGQEILRLFLDEQCITIKKIKEVIGISEKTIIKELNSLESTLKAFELELIRKPRVGISIQGSKDISKTILQITASNQKVVPNSPEQRQIYIMKRLLNNSTYVTMHALADEIFVSKKTIENDIVQVEKLLFQYGVKLIKTPNRGMKLQGSEVALRSLLSRVLSNQESRHIMLSSEIDARELYSLLDEFLLKDISILQIEQLMKEVKNLEKKIGYQLSDYSYVSLIVHIIIAIERVKDGNSIQSADLDSVKLCKEYQLSEQFVKQVESIFNVNFPECESAYITLHLIGSKANLISTENVDYLIESNVQTKGLHEVVNGMLDEASWYLGMSIYLDDECRKGLLLHLRPAIERLKHGLFIHNPYTQEIKKQYQVAFQVASISSKVLCDYYNITIDDNELAYLALHFGGAMERTKQGQKIDVLRVLVVCSSGLGSSQLIATKIKHNFTNIEIVDVISVINLSDYENRHDIDFIISSISLTNTKHEVIKISPFISAADLKKVRQFSHEIAKVKENTQKNKVLNQLFQQELLLPHVNVNTKEEVLSYLSEYVLSKGYVQPDFLQSVLKREEKGSTANAPFALPHANPKYVNKPGILLCTLEHPIDWDDVEVQVIFLIMVNHEVLNELEDVYLSIHNWTSSKEWLKKVKRIRSSNEMYSFLMHNKGD